jgi:nitrite reductase/ring-hydroxylating ferredoxin subunit
VAEKVVKIATTDEVPPGHGKALWAGGRLIALFNVNGTFYAIDNECPHSGGPLGEGSLKGNVVSCPWHLWQYDVTSGACLSNPFAHVRSYPLRISAGEVWLTIPL